MPTPIQVGEAQARLRRLLKIDAGMALSADEVVAAIAIIGDASEPPYRTDGQAFISLPNVQALVAAQFTYQSISGPTTGKIIVDGFVAAFGAAGEGSLFAANGFLGIGAITPVATEAAQPGNNAPYPGMGARVNSGNSAATPAGNELWRFQCAATLDVFRLPVPVVVPADPLGTGIVQLLIRPNTLAIASTVQWFGRVFE